MTSGWRSLDEALSYGTGLLVGEAVRLRATTEQDLVTLDTWWNDPQVAIFNMRSVRPRMAGANAEKLRGWSDNAVDGTTVGFSVVTRDGDEFAGHVSLFNLQAKERSATFGIVMGPPFWSRGLGTEATRLITAYGFRELGLHRIQLSVWAFNERAVAAYGKAGYQVEGRHRDVAFHDGRWHDELTMAVLEQEWAEADRDAG